MLTITKADLPVLSLLNYPYVHFHLSDYDIQKALVAPNRFLINIDADSHVWLVVRRYDDNILFHEISVFKDQNFQHYIIGSMTPQVRLEHVLEIAMKHFCENSKSNIPIETAVYRQSGIGSVSLPSLTGKFGFGFEAKLNPKSFGFSGTIFVRILDSHLLPNANCDDLEKLVSARHENVCSVLDYFREDWVVLFTEKCKLSLDKHFETNMPFAMSSYISWLYQFYHGLRYLLEHNFFCERLSIRSLLLSASGTIKVCDFWPNNFQGGETLSWLSQPIPQPSSFRSGTGIHRDLWRTTPPEILTGCNITPLSVSYSFGAVGWQILTHNLLPFRYMFAVEMDYLNSHPITDNAFFPGMDSKKINSKTAAVKAAIRGAERTFKILPVTPEKLRELLLQCLLYDSSKRPSLSDINPVVTQIKQTYTMIHKLDSVLKHFSMKK